MLVLRFTFFRQVYISIPIHACKLSNYVTFTPLGLFSKLIPYVLYRWLSCWDCNVLQIMIAGANNTRQQYNAASYSTITHVAACPRTHNCVVISFYFHEQIEWLWKLLQFYCTPQPVFRNIVRSNLRNSISWWKCTPCDTNIYYCVVILNRLPGERYFDTPYTFAMS